MKEGHIFIALLIPPVERLDKTSTAYGMKISAKKTKLKTNNNSDINTEIKVNGQKLQTVTSFKYLGSVLTDEGSTSEIFSRTAQVTAQATAAQATAALARLNQLGMRGVFL